MLKSSKILLAAALAWTASVPAFSAVPQAGRLIVKGVAAMKAKQYSEAVVLFDKATRVDTKSPNAYFHLGEAYFYRAFLRGTPELADKNDAANAIAAYETAVALDPDGRTLRDRFILYHGLAQCYEAQERYDLALKAIKKMVRVSPRNPMPHIYGARIRYKMRDWDMSSKNLYYGVRRAQKARMYPQLAKLIKRDSLFADLLHVPQNRAIIESFDAVADGTLTMDEAKERIRGADNFRDALTEATVNRRPASIDAPVIDPEVQKALTEAKNAFAAQRFSVAIEAYQGALTADAKKGTLDKIQTSLIYERIGASYRKLGLAGEALRVLEKSVAEMPQNSSALYEMSLCYSMAGEVGTSLSYLNKALDNAATKPQLRTTLMMARTDEELAPLRATPRFQEIIGSHSRSLR